MQNKLILTEISPFSSIFVQVHVITLNSSYLYQFLLILDDQRLKINLIFIPKVLPCQITGLNQSWASSNQSQSKVSLDYSLVFLWSSPVFWGSGTFRVRSWSSLLILDPKNRTGLDFQTLFMVDNSQGHSAYPAELRWVFTAKRNADGLGRKGFVAKRWSASQMPKKLMQSRSYCLLCHSPHVITARFPWTKVPRSRDHWECRSSVHLPSKISLWVELHWIFLGCSQTISPRALWLFIWQTEGKPSWCPCLSWHINHSEVGALYDSVGGCIQRWKRCQGSSGRGKEVQFSRVYFTLSYSRESCCSIRLD